MHNNFDKLQNLRVLWKQGPHGVGFCGMLHEKCTSRD